MKEAASSVASHWCLSHFLKHGTLTWYSDFSAKGQCTGRCMETSRQVYVLMSFDFITEPWMFMRTRTIWYAQPFPNHCICQNQWWTCQNGWTWEMQKLTSWTNEAMFHLILIEKCSCVLTSQLPCVQAINNFYMSLICIWCGKKNCIITPGLNFANVSW